MSVLLFTVSAALLLTASIAFAIAAKGARRRSTPLARRRLIPALVATAPSASYPSHTRILVMR